MLCGCGLPRVIVWWNCVFGSVTSLCPGPVVETIRPWFRPERHFHKSAANRFRLCRTNRLLTNTRVTRVKCDNLSILEQKNAKRLLVLWHADVSSTGSPSKISVFAGSSGSFSHILTEHVDNSGCWFLLLLSVRAAFLESTQTMASKRL